jgi:hypothetical protein
VEQGFSGAQAGDIEINGTGLITIDGAVVSNAVNTGGVGNAGNILVFSNSLFLNNGGIISSQSFGREESDAGDILVYVPSIMIQGESSGIFSQVAPGVQGNSGNISIFTSSLILTDKARINASNFGIGNAGTIEIQSSEKVEISDNASLWTTIEAGGVGITGNIIIDSPIVTLTNSNLYLNNGSIPNLQ